MDFIGHPACYRYHLLFSLTGGGKYNFLGTKRWLEENMDHAGERNYHNHAHTHCECLCKIDPPTLPHTFINEYTHSYFILFPLPESSLLHDNVAFVLCLDTLANGDELYLHVSRPPKPGSPQHEFIYQLEQV